MRNAECGMRNCDKGWLKFVLVLVIVLDLNSISCSLNRETKPRQTILHEDFSRPVTPASGKSFGKAGFLTLELFRGGTFDIDGSGPAVQKSESYRDSAWIRSTHP